MNVFLPRNSRSFSSKPLPHVEECRVRLSVPNLGESFMTNTVVLVHESDGTSALLKVEDTSKIIV